MKQQLKSQKVLFVTHKYPPSIGGMQKQSFELIKNYQQIDSCSVISFNSKYPIWLFFVIVIPWITIRILSDPKITLIHGNDGLMGLFLTPFLLTRKKLFVTIHGLDIVYDIKPYQWWIRSLLSKFDGVIAVSKQTKDECLQRGLNNRKVIYVPNAVTPLRHAEKDKGFISKLSTRLSEDLSNRIIIASVGRAIPRKGFSWFAKEILPKLPQNVVYCVVGPGEKNEKLYTRMSRILPASLFKKYCQFNGISLDHFELKKLKSDPSLQKKLFLLGKLSQEDLDQLYLHADIFAMPNLKVKGDYEGFGLVAQEAVNAGALCIASDIDGIPSAIENNKTGLLIQSGQVETWSNTFLRFVNDPPLLRETQEKYQQAMKELDHSWSKMAKQYFDFFSLYQDSRD